MKSHLPQESVDDAPLPVVSLSAPDASARENPWQTMASIFSISAQVERRAHIVEEIEEEIIRSPFRLGEMQLNDTGICLQGRGIRDDPQFTKFVRVGYTVLIVGWLVLGILFLVSFQKLLFQLLLAPVTIAVFAVGVELTREWRRGPIDIRIAWDDVFKVQIGPWKNWAVMLYRKAMTNPNDELIFFLLPITADSSTIHLMAETIERFAPGRIHYEIPSPVRARRVAILQSLLLLAFVGLLGYLMLHH